MITVKICGAKHLTLRFLTEVNIILPLHFIQAFCMTLDSVVVVAYTFLIHVFVQIKV